MTSLDNAKERLRALRDELDKLEVCDSCGLVFEPKDIPGQAACPHCGSYLRWSDLLSSRAMLATLPCAVAPSPTEPEPSHVEQLRRMYRKQLRRGRREDKTNEETTKL